MTGLSRRICVIKPKQLISLLIVLTCYGAIHILHLSPTPKNGVNTTAITSSNDRQTEDYPSEFDGLPKDVYYFWCENNKMFEFQHYLSVRSVLLHLNPYRVRLFHEYDPVTQELGHNTWLTELRHDNAFFSTEKLPGKWCADKQRNIDEYLSNHGGIYVHEEVVLAGPLAKEWLQSFDSVRVIDDDTKNKLLQVSRRKSSIPILPTPSTASIASIPMRFINGEAQLKDSRIKTGMVEMISSRPILAPQALQNVLLFKAGVSVVPEHIWEWDSEAGQILRTASYGKPDIARPVQDFSSLAPNIAHIVWSNNDTMRFELYLCVLSLLEVAKFDNVIIHGDGPPTGRYWGLIKDHPRLRLFLRTLIDGERESVYSNAVKNRAHVVDVLRIDIMNRYGGLYVDTDVIFFRPLTRELRAYDVVLSPDIAQGQKSFPNVYQNGVMLGKPGASFWRFYLESFRKYYDHDWLWNSNFGLYRIKERHPTTVLNEPRLNTICWNNICHPFWKPHDSDGPVDLVRHWKNNMFALQNCGPPVEEHSSPEALLKNNGSTVYGAVAMYVLEQSGKLDFFRKLANNGTQNKAV